MSQLIYCRFNSKNSLNRSTSFVLSRDNIAIVTGVGRLNGAEVYSSNLRAGAALILLALAAEDDTTICDLQHVWRGYEGLVEKLRALGAEIEFTE